MTPSAPSVHSRQRLFDSLLIAVVLLFAFLAASFAVRNSDFWMHLASGRLLAEGRCHFGVDPFAYTTAGAYWANHAWLFDLLLYLLRERFGDAALVVLKASLIVVLAAFMLSVRRPGSRVVLPAACTLLAVLAMSPRLLLHSTLLSYVLLGLTLWLLWRPGRRPATFRQQLRHYAPLLALFVLWVNVDGWFLLGPLLAALFWLGDRIAPARSEGEPPRRTPAWLWLAGLALLVLNPHHVETSMLPVELMPLPSALRPDVRFGPLHATPWRMGLYYHPLAGVNWASAAYLVLLLAGALSFVLNGRALAGWRLLVWLTFAGLSAWLLRAIPFFAVVAGPITALNVQDFLSRLFRREGDKRHLLVSLSPSLLVFAAGLALIGLAWPGWLQGFQDAGRHVDWAVQPDASLRRVAEKLQQWHKQGKLGDGRGFLYHPSLVHYCAWYCPEEKGFLDRRLDLFASVAGQYEDICRALNPAVAPAGSRANGDWRSLLREWNITHLVLYDPALPRLFPALKQLAGADGDWTLLDIDGQALIVGWKDGDRLLPEGVAAFDADRLAFAPAADSEDESMIPQAPEGGPARGPRLNDFRTHFGSPIPPPGWGTDAAGVLLRSFEDRVPRQSQQRATRCFAWAATLPGLPALSAGVLDGSLRLLTWIETAPFAAGDLGQQSSALPLLAVRAARRAVADNPDDAGAYLQLGRAYLLLAQRTPERAVSNALQPLAHLRHIQIAAALENAVRRNPDLEPAHEELANLYERRHFLDSALDHRREALRLIRQTGPLPGEPAETFDRRLDRLQDSVHEMERQMGESKNEYALHARNLGAEPYRKAQLALRLGFARLALEDVLMQSQVVLLGGDGVRLQLELWLQLGRVDLVRDQLHDPDYRANQERLGLAEIPVWTATGPTTPYRLPAYDWLLLCQSAAFGDYDEANDAVSSLVTGLGGRQAAEDLAKARPNAARFAASEIALASFRPSWFLRRLERDHLLAWLSVADRAAYPVAEQADLHVLAGLLSLERGRPREAEKSFRAAVALSRLGAGRPLAQAYLRMLHDARH